PAGTCGPQPCFSVGNLVLASGMAVSLGYVGRDGNVDPVRVLEVIVGVASDCLTPRLVEATAVCESGRELVVRTTRKHQTFVDLRDWFVATDTLFEVEADGHIGIADLNLTVNPQQGRQAPLLVMR